MANAVTRRPTLLAAVAALLGVTGLLVVTNAATATAGVSWSAVNPPMPANAVAGQGLTYASTSCPVDGWCVAVGDYLALTGTTYYEPGLIATESGSTWSASQAPLPGNAAVDPQALLQSVTCTGVGSCVAAGRYLDASGATQALVEQLSDGTWTASEVSLPSDAVVTGSTADAQLATISCPSTGWCTAAGLYTSQTAGEQALVDTEVAGNWSAAAAPLPTTASGSQFLSLACPAVGSCVAAGTYEVGGIYLGLVDTFSAGTWTAATLPLPPGTSSQASIANNDLSVSCPAAASCVIAGTTFDGNYEGLVDTLSGGSWTATSVPTPDGSASTDLQLTSVACPDASDCVATGFFLESGVEQGLIDTLASGAWTPSVAPTPPATPVGANIEIHNVACPATGTCVAVGQSDTAGTVGALLWNLTSGSWVVTPAPLPADASASSDPSFAPITCPAAGVCLAVGTYLGTGGREGVVETDPSLAATTTAVKLAQASSSAFTYSATVTGAAGPTGSVVFSAGLIPLCTATITNGSASCTGPMPKAHTVVGSYSGDSSSAPSWGSGASPTILAAVTATAGYYQAAKVNTFFATRMQAKVTDTTGAPVAGVVVTFTLPATTGASAYVWGSTTAVTNAAGIAICPYLSADGATGIYGVWATVSGISGSAGYLLANVK
ncbi:MAG TPA: hypothetical protein VII76_08515 [Acidimicrobiales bacterium]